MDDRSPWLAPEAIRARRAISKEHGIGAHQSIVVDRHDDRDRTAFQRRMTDGVSRYHVLCTWATSGSCSSTIEVIQRADFGFQGASARFADCWRNDPGWPYVRR